MVRHPKVLHQEASQGGGHQSARGVKERSRVQAASSLGKRNRRRKKGRYVEESSLAE